MTELWESCPMKDKPTQHYYDLRKPFESATYRLDLEMWNWLEKVKVELNKNEAVLSVYKEFKNIPTYGRMTIKLKEILEGEL